MKHKHYRKENVLAFDIGGPLHLEQNHFIGRNKSMSWGRTITSKRQSRITIIMQEHSFMNE